MALFRRMVASGFSSLRFGIEHNRPYAKGNDRGKSEKRGDASVMDLPEAAVF
jgi:hypothetical protein